MKKSQVDIISAMLILLIALSLTGTAYLWGYPLIQKRQASATVDRVYSYFSQDNSNSLPSVIEYVANNKGEKTFSLDIDGTWHLNEAEDSIQFSFLSKASNIAVDTLNPISLTPGVSCAPGPSPNIGRLGLDKASVVCARASSYVGMINISYKVWFRELYADPPSSNGFKINLVKESGLEYSRLKSIKIIFSGTEQEQVGGKTLIKTKIKILLI